MKLLSSPEATKKDERGLAVALALRYGAVTKAAWQARHDLVGPRLLADEAAFLPAALSLQATPVHPAPRRAAWVICGVFTAAIVWSLVGEIDIVATTSGHIVVSDHTKVVQPLEAGVVRRLLVKDGDSVKAGQPLLELDATSARADERSMAEQLAAATSDEWRCAALLAALAQPASRSAAFPAAMAEHSVLASGGNNAADERSRLQFEAEWQDIRAKFSKLDAERAQRAAEVATVNESIHKLQAVLPMARQREADINSLVQQGFMSGHAGQDRTRERVEQERDLVTAQARLAEAQAALREAEQERVAYQAESRRLLNDRLAAARLKREGLTQELSKVVQRAALTTLTAPVDGTVQQLAIHTEGGVVTPAQALMVIVPKDAAVTAQVDIDNKDIGFIAPGQEAVIKLETFPFSKYGTVSATVESVSADAVPDEKRGWIFPAVIRLRQTQLQIDERQVDLTPGMALSAEIKTGERRIFEYLWRPAKKALHDSLKER